MIRSRPLLARPLVAVVVLGALAVVALAGPPAAGAQARAKPYRIGYLANTSAAPAAPYLAVFREELRGLGYREGRDYVIEPRWADGRDERLPALAEELVKLKVDAIVAQGGAIRAAKNATTTIPIVMAVSNDPVGEGFVANLARPGGNITGTSMVTRELDQKRLDLLREALPRLSRVAVLSNPLMRPSAVILQELEGTARALRVTLGSFEFARPEDFEPVFAAIRKERPDALLVPPDPFSFANRTRLAAFVREARLPAIYGLREYVDAGGLLSYGVSLRERYRRAASYVDRILKGARPGDLPVEQPTRFELVVNLKTAKALGLAVPRSLLLRADEVLE